jgi:hypothetical protein
LPYTDNAPLDCLWLAEKAKSVSERAKLVQMAQEWYELARRLEEVADEITPAWEPPL